MATIFVDNERPEVTAQPVSIELTNDSSVWELLNKLSFGVFFNKELKVTVEVKDAASYGDELHYEIAKADGMVENGKADIEPAGDGRGEAVFKLPLGTKGSVRLTAYDKAGNKGPETELRFEEGQVYWELEDQSPSIVDVNPAPNASNVDITDLDSIWLVFDERVELTNGDGIVLTVDGKSYTVQDTGIVNIFTMGSGSAAGETTEEASEDNLHERWYVELPIDSFRGEQGEPIELVAGALHQIVVKGAPFGEEVPEAERIGAFSDTAGNPNNSYTFYFTADEIQGSPVIGDINIELPEGSVMSPADFESEREDYVLLVMDEAMKEDGSGLLKDLEMSVELINGTYHIDRAELTDIYGNVIAGTDELWRAESATEGTISIPADSIRASENYFIKITATQYGASRTYSFFISTSAISAVAEDVGDIGVSVDTDELIESMGDRLETDAIRDWKVVIKFRAAAIPVSSAGAELEAVIKALEAAGINDSSLGFQPMDLSVTEYHGRTGETEAIAKLDKPITVTIAMPEDSEGREIYGIYRYDEATGTAVKVEHTLSADGKTAVIVTADFSGTYAIVYDDKPASTGGGSGGSGGSGGGGGGGGTGGSGTLTVSGTTAYYGGTWVNDGWLFKEADGRVPQNEWLRIDGKIYRFGLDGFMDPDYNGYRYNTDGSLAVALPEGETARDAVGTWLQDGWRYVISGSNNLSNGWYYLFYQGRFEWYYFNAEGWMLDGWRDINGETYYLHTVHDWTRGRMYTDWHFIDGKWYYFRTKAEGNEGALVRNQYTITGHFVGADGAWDGNGPAPTEAQ